MALVSCLQVVAGAHFNNVMAEIYDGQYRTMGYHSDQALDLDPDSFIGIFSLYDQRASEADWRVLQVKHKQTGETTDIVLEPYSFILFSVAANQDHVHRIVLRTPNSRAQWLGLTVRQSKTFISFPLVLGPCGPVGPKGPVFHGTATPLLLATPGQQRDFCTRKRAENNGAAPVSVAPSVTATETNYTMSASDLLPPTAR
jgi:hypothetical protein